MRRGRRNSRITSAIHLVGFRVAAQRSERLRRNVFRSKAKVLHDFVARGRSAVVIDADCDALITDKLAPSQCRGRFHADALLNRLW